MSLTETYKTSPIQAEKSVRRDDIKVLTAGYAGKIIPLKYIPVLREDRVSGGCRIKIEMDETAELLMTAVNVDVQAWFVPFLAFDRFDGLDQFNRSYRGQAEGSGQVVPFINGIPFNSGSPVNRALGLHGKQGDTVNGAYLEAFNLLVNHRYEMRSDKITPRAIYDHTLPKGFWHHSQLDHIVPDFDQAAIDGEVMLNLDQTKLPVRGILTGTDPYQGSSSRHGVGGEIRDDGSNWFSGAFAAQDPNNMGFPDVYAELAQEGVTLSLSNIELAKKTAAFAKIRDEYKVDDEHILDLLMSGIRVPEVEMSKPLLLDRQKTIFGYDQRYATDGANLEKSVTTGETIVDLRFRTPHMNTGGIIFITAEISPDQVFERRKDYFLHATTPAEFPDFMRDYLDPEKVAVVQNDHIDIHHTQPDATFGYAGLNHQWDRTFINLGDRYYREVGDPFDEDRQRVWDNTTVDPTFTEDFMLMNEIHHNVFASDTVAPFNFQALGEVEIVGNTVFGKRLVESTGSYDALIENVDTTRVDLPEE